MVRGIKVEKIIVQNHMKMIFDAKSENEALARMAVAVFVAPIDPTIEEMNDIKTAVSEAVTNSIIHGYCEKEGDIYINCMLKSVKEKEEYKYCLTVQVEDKGVGIENIKQAMEPLYTSKPELERSGMGFMFMELFMDHIDVESKVGEGTKVIMTKIIKKAESLG